LPAKIIVTAEKGGSRVALIGTSGKQLLASEVFSEPRAKGATLRALRGLLGENVVVEDNTLASARPAKAAPATNGTTRPAARPRKSASKAAATKAVAKRAARPARKATKAAKATKARS
jgi:topoisomerase IA-like protein